MTKARLAVALVLSVPVAAIILGAATRVLGAGRGRTPPPPPPPPVTLELDAPTLDHGWTVKLKNTGIDPVRIVADARLLSFDVTSGTHTQHCTLPADMIPSTDTERTLVVPGNRSWSVHLDPLLYCFGAAQVAALVPGAVVTASFGWISTRYQPPFAVIPTTMVDGGVGAARIVTAAAVTLAAPPELDAGTTIATHDAATPTPPDAYPVHFKTSLPERLDVSHASGQSVTVSIQNDTDRSVRTLATPPTIGFIVYSPTGAVSRCGADMGVGAIAELTTTFGPHARSSVTVDLGAICGAQLRKPGLYRIRPRLDTRHTTPPTGATSFWSGEAVGAPMLLRVRVGEDPLPMTRLDPP